MDILLIGPRGCGKTVVGRALATLLERSFLDLDERVLVEFTQKTIREVFAGPGEAAWREAEGRVMGLLLQKPAEEEKQRVIALGGGTPIVPEAHQSIIQAREENRIRVAYLRSSVEKLAERLKQDPADRPPLTDKTVHEEIAGILAEREPVYVELADLVLEVDEGSPEQHAKRIAAWVREEID